MRVPAARDRGLVLVATLLCALSCGRVNDTMMSRVPDGWGSGGANASAGGSHQTGGGFQGTGGPRTGGSVTSGGAAGTSGTDAGKQDAGPGDASVPSEDGGATPPSDAGTDGSAILQAAEKLVGSYDVWVTPQKIPHCVLATTGRLNLVIALKDGALVAYLFEDGKWGPQSEMNVAFGKEDFVLDPTGTPDGDFPDYRPRLLLHWGSDGFVSDGGRAGAKYTCDDGTVKGGATNARIEADHTAPRLIARPYEDLGRVFSYTWFAFVLTEPAHLTSLYPQNDSEDIDVRNQVDLVDVATSLPVPLDYRSYPWGGPQTDAVFLNPDDAIGKTIRAVPVNLTDIAGNAATEDTLTREVFSPGPVAQTLDFDQGPSESAYGSFTYVPAGSPCESGGCLVLEGALHSCDDPGRESTGLVARFPLTADRSRVTVRYQLWTQTAKSVAWYVGSGVACGQDLSPTLAPLGTPDGGYEYATGFTEDTLTACMGEDGTKAFVLQLPCSKEPLTSPETTRVVVETMTLGLPLP